MTAASMMLGLGAGLVGSTASVIMFASLGTPAATMLMFSLAGGTIAFGITATIAVRRGVGRGPDARSNVQERA
jgi:hypothetical protein